MYLGFWNFYNAYNGNRMFLDASSTTAGDDLSYGSVYLGQRLRGLGHQVATLDMDDLEKFDAAVFFDHPTFLNGRFRELQKLGKKLYLFLAENEANRPDNYWKWNWRPFHKVFTWDPTLVDNKKVFRIWHTIKIPSPFSINVAEKTKFCLTISSQKYLSHPLNLYGERVEIIRWFERNHPDKFDLYGGRWDRRYFTGKLSRLNYGLQPFYSRFPRHFKVNLFPSHRGSIPNKNAVMRHYKYAVVYENAVFPGYVSEKIFDAFFSGCIPIYLGAPDITDHVPAETFIDRNNFHNHEQLYKYLSAMPEKEYLGYIKAIEDYVRSDKIQVFSAESITKIFLKEIVEPFTTQPATA